MAYLLDGAVILLFVAAVIVGYKKGLVGTVLNVVVSFAALISWNFFSAALRTSSPSVVGGQSHPDREHRKGDEVLAAFCAGAHGAQGRDRTDADQ